MTHSLQYCYNPMDYHFTWTEDDWYKWDAPAARKAAQAKRRERAKELRKDGWKVRLWSMSNQLISRGGIGSGHPHIDQWTTVYMLDAERK